MSEAKHTAGLPYTPVTVESSPRHAGLYRLIYHNGDMLCSDLLEVEARELARIINSHNDLLAACKAIAEWDRKNPKGRIYPIGPNDVEEQLDAIVEQAKSAIARAEGREG